MARLVNVSYNYCGKLTTFGSEVLASKIIADKKGMIQPLETRNTRIVDSMDVSFPGEPNSSISNQECSNNQPTKESLNDLCNSLIGDQYRVVYRDYANIYKEAIQEESYDNFLRRNQTMAKKILEAIKKRERPFIIVGLAHVIGPIGIHELLSLDGITVRKIK